MVEPKPIKSAELAFPMKKVRSIMKSSANQANYSTEAVYAVSKSTEMFINFLVKNSYKNCQGEKELQYQHLSSLASEDQRLQFMLQIIPKKVTVADYKKIVASMEEGEFSDSDLE